MFRLIWNWMTSRERDSRDQNERLDCLGSQAKDRMAMTREP